MSVVPTADDRPTMSVREAAPLLGVSAASLYRSIAEGTSPVAFVKCGQRRVIVTADLRRVLHLDTNGHTRGEDRHPKPVPVADTRSVGSDVLDRS